MRSKNPLTSGQTCGGFLNRGLARPAFMLSIRFTFVKPTKRHHTHCQELQGMADP